MSQSSQQNSFVYIGTYTQTLDDINGKGEGIYVFRIDPSSGALSYVSTATGDDNPTYVVISKNQRWLYAASETYGDCGPFSYVSAYAIDPEDGSLTLLNRQSSHGLASCYLSVDSGDRYVLVANYVKAGVAVLPIQEDGSLGEAVCVVPHHGAGALPEHQDEAHTHGFILDANDRYAFAPDKGADKIFAYRFDVKTGQLEPADPPWYEARPGAGPRNFIFHPSQAYAYVINELNGTIVAFAYDSETGRLKQLQEVSTLPEGTDRSTLRMELGAGLRLHPSGRFIYGSNRGHDSIVIYAIDQETGRLSYVGHQSTQGSIPRGFDLSPCGRLLVVGNRDSDSVIVFNVDQETGKLTPAGQEAHVPTPVIVRFARPPQESS